MAHWPLHSNVCYLAACLEGKSWEVDVFLYESDERFSGDLLRDTAGIRVHRLGAPRPGPDGRRPRILRRIWARAEGRFRRTRFASPFDNLRERFWRRVRPQHGLLPDAATDAIVLGAGTRPYAALIGVEKGGLAWAGTVAARTRTPLVYYSLELYTRDHPWIVSSLWMQRFKALEESYHRRCAATIIQDPFRGKVLLADNRVRRPMRMAYLPISLSGGTVDTPSRWLQDRLGSPPGEKLILCYGEVSGRRLSPELARLAQGFPEDWRLVFHGFGEPDAIGQVRGIDLLGRVGISTTLVPAIQRQELVRSAHIGLALYGSATLNDRLTGRSSEKIAMYLQCGIPLIAFRYPSYEHIEAEGSGILIDGLDEIPGAVARILGNYDFYVRNARSCYRRHYCFEDNFEAAFPELEAAARPPSES